MRGAAGVTRRPASRETSVTAPREHPWPAEGLTCTVAEHALAGPKLDRPGGTVAGTVLARIGAVAEPVAARCARKGSLGLVERPGSLARASTHARVGTEAGIEKGSRCVLGFRAARAHPRVAVAAAEHIGSATPRIAPCVRAEIGEETEKRAAARRDEVDRRALVGTRRRGEGARRVHESVTVVVVAVADLGAAAAAQTCHDDLVEGQVEDPRGLHPDVAGQLHRGDGQAVLVRRISHEPRRPVRPVGGELQIQVLALSLSEVPSSVDGDALDAIDRAEIDLEEVPDGLA